MKPGFGLGLSEQPSSHPDSWTRLEKIQYLLDQWDVIFDPNTVAPFGSPGDGSGCPLMPLMSRHPSVLELSRCLGLLFTASPGDYRHLKAYRGSEWRVVWTPTWIRGPQGKRIAGEPRPERRRILYPWLDQKRVQRAERFLVDRFKGEVFIPDELWDAIVKPAVTTEPDTPVAA